MECPTLAASLRYRDQIWGKLMAENAVNLSNETIESILSPCVGGAHLVPMARILRDSGLLKLAADPYWPQ